jgi:chromate transporter
MGARPPRPILHQQPAARGAGARGIRLTLFASTRFVFVLVGAGLAYEMWTNGERWIGRANSFSPGAVAVALVLGVVTISLSAPIFLEGLKAGLLTFGGAYTVIPFLQQFSVDHHH